MMDSQGRKLMKQLSTTALLISYIGVVAYLSQYAV